MGIDINCTKCRNFEGKQTFASRSGLLDGLRRYLTHHKEEHELELKLVNWFYRYDDDDENRVVHISDEEKQEAQKLLREKDLYGLFCYTFLEEDSGISSWEAERFMKTYDIIKDFLTEKFALDVSMLYHAASKKHDLITW